MSHRKYEQPRHGSLGFLPRKRTKHHQGRIRAFPKDDASKKPALTAFMGYKAGMLHVVRDSAVHKMELVEAVSIIETPPMVVCGVVGYTETPNGLRALTTVWSSLLSESFKRRFYKHWYRCKGKAFDKYVATNYTNGKANATVERDLARIKKYCSVVRVIAHTQPRRVNIGRKKANVLEIQVNGGSVSEKVDYAVSLFEQEVPVDTVFSQDEFVDIMGVTKGHGFEGVITRWGVTTLPRKTHRGLRKVACIGAWHPSRIRYTVARPGQHGYFHRTEINKKIYRIGKGAKPNGAKEVVNFNASTESDLTQKVITPMGGFSSYSNVNEDFLMIKGAIVGCRTRPLTLRKSLIVNTRPTYTEKTVLKFISTASQRGHGKFQTSGEKSKFYGK